MHCQLYITRNVLSSLACAKQGLPRPTRRLSIRRPGEHRGDVTETRDVERRPQFIGEEDGIEAPLYLT
jgi:hypothetical protein